MRQSPSYVIFTQKYYFKFNSEIELIGRITGGLTTSEAARFTNVMRVSQMDQNSVFAADALNAVMKEYVVNDIVDKQKSATQMVAYIKKQLDFITKEVDSSGNDLRRRSGLRTRVFDKHHAPRPQSGIPRRLQRRRCWRPYVP